MTRVENASRQRYLGRSATRRNEEKRRIICMALKTTKARTREAFASLARVGAEV